MTESRTDTDLDRIERSIEIDASAERVFDLVSRPGWWINDGEVDPEPTVTYEDDVALVVHEQWGTFRIQSVRSDRPTYASFRWLDREDPSAGTTVEFFITPADGADAGGAGVTLRVLETGFTQLGNSNAQVVLHVNENTAGWESELAAAQRFVTDDGE